MALIGLMFLLAAPAAATEPPAPKPMIMPDPDAGKDLLPRKPMAKPLELPERKPIFGPTGETPYELAKRAWMNTQYSCASHGRSCFSTPPVSSDFLNMSRF